MAEVALLERHGRVAVFTLNRPDQRNAVNPELTARMNELVPEFEADPDLWVGVVTGAGETFCAGADLKAIAEGRLREIVDVEPGGFAGLIRPPRTKPMIAAVNGHALAGGWEIALACDVVVAAENASFGLPEVRRGIIAGAGGLQRLPRLIPPLRALEIIMTGRLVPAAEAHALGVVNEVVPRDQVLPRALELAETIAANAPIAVRESLSVARTTMRGDEDPSWQRATEAWERVLASEDAREGPRAFAEKREPAWSGR